MADATLHCVGIDHHQTPLAIRERLAVADIAMPVLLSDLNELPGVNAAVVLSTCNRVEIYWHGNEAQVLELLAEFQGVAVAELQQHVFRHMDDAVVRHLFRVISSIESLVIGEYQIVHQVKNAYEQARREGHTNGLVDRLFQQALGIAKTVRNQTGIGHHKVSVASVGVDLARQIHGNLKKTPLLVVGAGEIAELALIHLVEAGVNRVTLINRTHERALDLAADQRLAQIETKVLRWADLGEAMRTHDIVLTSTSATRPVITAGDVKAQLRGRRTPLMFIDLAVPRDVETAVGDLGDVYRYDLDHLDRVVAENRAIRADEVTDVEALIETAVKAHDDGQRLNDSGIVSEIARYFDSVVQTEHERLRHKIGQLDEDELHYGLKRVGNKLQHRMLAYLREHQGDTDAEALIRTILDL